jgi:hypothetical protein
LNSGGVFSRVFSSSSAGVRAALSRFLGSTDIEIALDKNNAGLLAQEFDGSVFLARGYLPRLDNGVAGGVVSCLGTGQVGGDTGVGSLDDLDVQGLENAGSLKGSTHRACNVHCAARVRRASEGIGGDAHDQAAGNVDGTVVGEGLLVLRAGRGGGEEQRGKQEDKDEEARGRRSEKVSASALECWLE